MNAILQVGEMQRTDSDGFIINESSVDKITPPWKEIVEALKDACIQDLGDKVHSLYVRGSVARGCAVEGVSDVDALAVTVGNFKEADHQRVMASRRAIEVAYPFCKGVELRCISHDLVFRPTSLPVGLETNWKMIIKTQCVCVLGQDLATELPKCRPGTEMVMHAFDIRNDIETMSDFLRAIRFLYRLPLGLLLLKWLGVENQRVTAETTRVIRWTMKRILRTGFEVVMEKEQGYTRDLYCCYDSFCKYFPEKEERMRKALELFVNPVPKSAEVLTFLDDFGPWITKRVEQEFGRKETKAGYYERFISLKRKLRKLGLFQSRFWGR